MLRDLDKYVVLIQLLVGSVFLSDHFFKPNKLFEEEKDNLRKKLTTQLQGEDLSNYVIIPNSSWDKQTKKVSMSVVVLLVLYGCIVLFYCASPSICPLGLFIESCLASLFQLYSIILYGQKRTITHRMIFYLTIVLCIIVFVVFFIVPGNNNIEIWFKRENVFFNAWVLGNFVLWFSVYIKCFRQYLMARTICLELYDWQLLKKLDIKSRMQNIMEQFSDSNCSLYDRIHLLKMGIRDLRKDKFYYSKRFDPNDSNKVTCVIDKDLKNSLLKMIDGNLSGLSYRLFQRIITKKIKNLKMDFEEENDGYFTETSEKQKSDQLRDILDRLYELGIVSKKDD